MRRPDRGNRRTILGDKECTAKTGFKPRKRKRLELAGEFPKRVTSYDGRIGWYEDEVEQAMWIWLNRRDEGLMQFADYSED